MGEEISTWGVTSVPVYDTYKPPAWDTLTHQRPDHHLLHQ